MNNNDKTQVASVIEENSAGLSVAVVSVKLMSEDDEQIATLIVDEDNEELSEDMPCELSEESDYMIDIEEFQELESDYDYDYNDVLRPVEETNIDDESMTEDVNEYDIEEQYEYLEKSTDEIASVLLTDVLNNLNS